MADEKLHLSGAVIADIDTDAPEKVIYLDYCGVASHSGQRWLIDKETMKPFPDPIQDLIRVEIPFNDIRKIYLTYMKQRLLENIMDMDDDALEEYLVEGC